MLYKAHSAISETKPANRPAGSKENQSREGEEKIDEQPYTWLAGDIQLASYKELRNCNVSKTEKLPWRRLKVGDKIRSRARSNNMEERKHACTQKHDAIEQRIRCAGRISVDRGKRSTSSKK